MPQVRVAQPQPPTPPPAPLPVTYGFEPVYERFRKHQPPNFDVRSNPIEAEEWLRSVESILEHMRLGNEDRVSCASSLLKKYARVWWDIVKQTSDVNIMTWDEFIQVVNKKYYNCNDPKLLIGHKGLD